VADYQRILSGPDDSIRRGVVADSHFQFRRPLSHRAQSPGAGQPADQPRSWTSRQRRDGPEAWAPRQYVGENLSGPAKRLRRRRCARRQCFASVRRHPAPGGWLIFDISKWDLALLARDPGQRYPVLKVNEVSIEETAIYDAAEQIRHVALLGLPRDPLSIASYFSAGTNPAAGRRRLPPGNPLRRIPA